MFWPTFPRQILISVSFACFCKLFAYNPSNNTKQPSVLLFNKKYLNHPVWILRTGIPSIINHLKRIQVRLTRFNQNFYCFFVLVLVLLNYTSGYLQFCNFFHFLNVMVKGFLKMYILSFFGHHFLQYFYFITGFCKKINFFQICKLFFQILKVEHQNFPMMYHFSFM